MGVSRFVDSQKQLLVMDLDFSEVLPVVNGKVPLMDDLLQGFLHTS